MEGRRVIVAGASGYLGKHIIRELQLRKIEFGAIVRKKESVYELNLTDKQLIEAEVTKPNTLSGIINNGDVLISCVGITRQKDGLTYKDVDFQANVNLLNEAKASGAVKVIYISVLNGELMRHLKLVEAKEAFVDYLKASTLNYTIIRPNGFFSDMKDFLQMARKGKVFLFGKSQFMLNPIHGADLARVVVDSIETTTNEIEVGGPDILTQEEIAELALKAFKFEIKISHIPDWVRISILALLRAFTTSKTYGPYEFFLSMMAQDNIAPRYGVHRLKDFFQEEADKIKTQKKTPTEL